VKENSVGLVLLEFTIQEIFVSQFEALSPSAPQGKREKASCNAKRI
jgi:hypothetical protein